MSCGRGMPYPGMRWSVPYYAVAGDVVVGPGIPFQSHGWASFEAGVVGMKSHLSRFRRFQEMARYGILRSST
jgi:hypothetical protein